jgi:hypothetical protein
VIQAIECEGVPRDLGLDQGRACREPLHGRFAGLPALRRTRLWLGRQGRDAARLRRDVSRHFPHLAESLAGLATGARVAPAWLALELAREEAAPLGAGVRGAETWLARGLPGEPLVRRSRPEGLFASVELTRPGLVAALAGVNERGLAVAAAGAGAPARNACAAPAWLLAQDCLERFAEVEAALAWCLERPGGGRGAILLADARGELAGVEFDGESRRVRRPIGGELVASGGGELVKRLREAGGAEACDPGGAGAVVIEPAARRLRVPGAVFSP